MNYKMMGRFLAQILSIEGVFMLPALAISLYCGETMAVRGYVMTLILIAALTAVLFLLCRGGQSIFRAREGMLPDCEEAQLSA